MTAVNLPFKKTRQKQNRSQIFTELCGLKSKSFFEKMIALRLLVGLAREIRRQIGNTGLVGIDAHLRKLLTSSVVCLVRHRRGKALSLETSSTIILRLTKVQNTYVFH